MGEKTLAFVQSIHIKKTNLVEVYAKQEKDKSREDYR